jgi:uncharacterized protein (TIGR03437 family)
MRTFLFRIACLVPLLFLLTPSLSAQQDRITSPVDYARTAPIRGHVPAAAQLQYDRGPVDPRFQMPSVTMLLKPSAAQQSGLQQLLAEQQNISSANYHRWLTPEQYADRFGASQNDIAQLSAWIASQGLTVSRVARSRNWIVLRGTAGQIEKALHTEIHSYNVRGESHFANATDPSVPAAFSGIVRSFFGLHDFRLKPRLVKRKEGPGENAGFGTHRLAPDDFATLYDITPLYQGSPAIDGTGQKLVVAGQTNIDITNIQTFRSTYNLPAPDAQHFQAILVSGETDPGIVPGDVDEADLDIEWSGAVARNAQIVFVYSGDVITSVFDAIDNNRGNVVSMSYGACEQMDLVDLPSYQAEAQKANSMGMTWVVSSGDSGAADCDVGAIAQVGLAVDAPASIPEVTAMGGTEFNEESGTYWNPDGSPIGYIPEKAWNDSILDGALSSGGGGVSVLFAKPYWQTGRGVPADGFRDVPDVSINASADHDGFVVYTSGSFATYGGTSMGAPTMAGIVTLLNQYLVTNNLQTQPGVGNINPELYRLAAVPGIFHDVTLGSNIVKCVKNTPNCTTGSYGYSAGVAYDQATGLGSPDVANLVRQWSTNAATSSAVVPSIDQNPVFQQAPDQNGNQWAFTITLTEEAGVATTLTEFTINGTAYPVQATFGTITIPADGSISSQNLGLATLSPLPSKVVFGFKGTDTAGQKQSWSQTLSIPFDGPQVSLSINTNGCTNAASGKFSYAPGMLLSIYGQALANFIQFAGAIPLPDFLAGFGASVGSVQAPLLYVSPIQVNLQVPYETGTGSADLQALNPYTFSDCSFNVTPAAPGIFQTNGLVSPPFSSAKPGQTTTLFITGAGLVNPSVATGDTPAFGTPLSQLPQPVLPVSVTVGGVLAGSTSAGGPGFEFIGIPPGLVGTVQINYTVPASTSVGVQPVVVTVGGVPSPPVNINVTQ